MISVSQIEPYSTSYKIYMYQVIVLQSRTLYYKHTYHTTYVVYEYRYVKLCKYILIYIQVCVSTRTHTHIYIYICTLCTLDTYAMRHIPLSQGTRRVGPRHHHCPSVMQGFLCLRHGETLETLNWLPVIVQVDSDRQQASLVESSTKLNPRALQSPLSPLRNVFLFKSRNL